MAMLLNISAIMYLFLLILGEKMYKIFRVVDIVRVPPQNFSMKFEDIILTVLREKYERTMDKDMGLILCIDKVKSSEYGRIIQGDGAAYFDVEFDALCFLPKINEVYRTTVKKVVDFGCFLSLGPIEGLVHISQITRDLVVYDRKNNQFNSKNGKKTLKTDDVCFAKISTVSIKHTSADTKIGLTMRPLGLGKEDWLEIDKKSKETANKKTKSKTKKK